MPMTPEELGFAKLVANLESWLRQPNNDGSRRGLFVIETPDGDRGRPREVLLCLGHLDDEGNRGQDIQPVAVVIPPSNTDYHGSIQVASQAVIMTQGAVVRKPKLILGPSGTA